MTPALRLLIASPVPAPNLWAVKTVRLRFEVLHAFGLDERVFVYSRSPVDPYTNLATDTFETVANPWHMANVPGSAPATGSPFLRHNFIELDLVPALAPVAEEKILERLQRLLDAETQLMTLQPQTELWLVGNAVPGVTTGSAPGGASLSYPGSLSESFSSE